MFLLVTLACNNALYFTSDRHLHKLPEILESSDLDMRIAAGEAISLLYELAREQDEVGHSVFSLLITII